MPPPSHYLPEGPKCGVIVSEDGKKTACPPAVPKADGHRGSVGRKEPPAPLAVPEGDGNKEKTAYTVYASVCENASRSAAPSPPHALPESPKRVVNFTEDGKETDYPPAVPEADRHRDAVGSKEPPATLAVSKGDGDKDRRPLTPSTQAFAITPVVRPHRRVRIICRTATCVFFFENAKDLPALREGHERDGSK